MEKSVIVKGPLNDMSDVLNAARDIGKKVFGVDRVRVHPWIAPYGLHDYVVVVDDVVVAKSQVVGNG